MKESVEKHRTLEYYSDIENILKLSTNPRT